MTHSAGSVAAFQGTALTLHGLAIAMTIFRVTYRLRRRAFYWDDGLAGLAGVFGAIHASMIFVRIVEKDRLQRGIPPTPREYVATYMVESLAYSSTLWAARSSIGWSIFRVLPPSLLRRIVLVTIASFACIWVVLCGVKISICLHSSTLPKNGSCRLGNSFIVTKLCFDVLANVLLVIISLIMLWDSQLPHLPRRIIRVIFALNILMTAGSCVHMVVQLRFDSFLEGFTAYYDGSISLISCNLLVIVTLLYRLIGCGRNAQTEVSLTEPDARTHRHTHAPSLTAITDDGQAPHLRTTFGGSVHTASHGSTKSTELTPGPAPPIDFMKTIR